MIKCLIIYGFLSPKENLKNKKLEKGSDFGSILSLEMKNLQIFLYIWISLCIQKYRRMIKDFIIFGFSFCQKKLI
jgi:hypothetical protein